MKIKHLAVTIDFFNNLPMRDGHPMNHLQMRIHMHAWEQMLLVFDDVRQSHDAWNDTSAHFRESTTMKQLRKRHKMGRILRRTVRMTLPPQESNEEGFPPLKYRFVFVEPDEREQLPKDEEGIDALIEQLKRAPLVEEGPSGSG